MPPKAPKGRPAQSQHSKTQPKSYVVAHSGSRHQTRISQLASSTRRERQSDEHLHDDLIVIGASVDTAIWEDEAPPASSETPNKNDEPTAALTELEQLIDDAPNVGAGNTRRGKGQNEMLEEWTRKWSAAYLRELFRMYRTPQSTPCECNSGLKPDFRCEDCTISRHLCQSCILTSHSYLPCHRIMKWEDTHWKKTTLREHGLVVNLAEHIGPCRQSETREFTLGDVTGFHLVNIRFCQCVSATEKAIQLLRNRIFPCSDENPSTGFTFPCLKFFAFASTEAKVSANRFYHLVQRSTNNIMPHYYPNRFREFIRVSRQWMYLKDHQRSGSEQPTVLSAFALALRCPACPRLNVNFSDADIVTGEEFLFWVLLNYDGSFQLVRRNRVIDAHDICLSDGMKYWVDKKAYEAHLKANKQTNYGQSTRGSSCNNHRAANDTWVRAAGVAETGLGAVTCARHTFYMPNGVVAYYMGERFAYTDYAVASVMKKVMDEGATIVGFFYDIFCHWQKNFWERSQSVLLPDGPLQRPDCFFGGIGKYHIPGHTDSCYAQYSLNNMTGVGRLDAEGCERAWADLNLASGSTSEKGPGARTDSINHMMHDWNWKKTVGMIALLIGKWNDASSMSQRQRDAWLAFDESLPGELTREWRTFYTEPTLKNGKWTSVFLMKETSTVSVTKRLLELNKEDQARSMNQPTNEQGLTVASWVAEGLEIEAQQRRLLFDLKDYGKAMTDKQALDLFRNRSSLSARIIRHRSHASFFIDLLVTPGDDTSSLAEETDGRPELATLYMPSSLGPQLSLTEQSSQVKATELNLRRVACLQALQKVRTTLINKALLLYAKEEHARGEIANTRAQAVVNRLSDQISLAVDDYETSRKTLKKLGATNQDINIFQKLVHNDFVGVISILKGRRTLGEGYKQLPWFWVLRESGQDRTAEEMQEEFNEASRVEWFRSRERYYRWEEEEKWLRRELSSCLLDFLHRSQEWQQRSQSDYARIHSGYKAYCYGQTAMWKDMCRDGLERCRHILESQPQLAICRWALSVLKGTLS